MTKSIEELIAQWNTDEGKPFKGQLIDHDRWLAGTIDPGCMCAQGQVLHFVGGYSIAQLARLTVTEADLDTARILNISLPHSVLLRQVNDTFEDAPAAVLTNPELFLGKYAKQVLAFWKHLETIPKEELKEINRIEIPAGSAEIAHRHLDNSLEDRIQLLATFATTCHGLSPRDNNLKHIVIATKEIQGQDEFRHNNDKFSALPMFGFSTPEEIPISIN